MRPRDRMPDERVREIAESPLSFAQGAYVDAWHLAREVAELRAYKERTEAALTEFSSELSNYGVVPTNYYKQELRRLGLWRECGA